MIKITYNWLLLRYTWIGGITLGHHIFFKRGKDRVTPEMILHEKCHVAQIERYGIFKFYLKYLGYSLVHGYKNNPLEKEARDAETSSIL